MRKVPEGGVWTAADDPDEIDFINNYPSPLNDTEKPIILEGSFDQINPDIEGIVPFDAVIGRNIINLGSDPEEAFIKINSILDYEGMFSIAETLPEKATRLSELISPKSMTEDENHSPKKKQKKTVYKKNRKTGA